MQDRQDEFRDYSDTKDSVKKTYKKMQRRQTLDFVSDMKQKYATEDGYTNKKGKKIRKRFEDAFGPFSRRFVARSPSALELGSGS